MRLSSLSCSLPSIMLFEKTMEMRGWDISDYKVWIVEGFSFRKSNCLLEHGLHRKELDIVMQIWGAMLSRASLLHLPVTNQNWGWGNLAFFITRHFGNISFAHCRCVVEICKPGETQIGNPYIMERWGNSQMGVFDLLSESLRLHNSGQSLPVNQYMPSILGMKIVCCNQWSKSVSLARKPTQTCTEAHFLVFHTFPSCCLPSICHNDLEFYQTLPLMLFYLCLDSNPWFMKRFQSFVSAWFFGLLPFRRHLYEFLNLVKRLVKINTEALSSALANALSLAEQRYSTKLSITKYPRDNLRFLWFKKSMVIENTEVQDCRVSESLFFSSVCTKSLSSFSPIPCNEASFFRSVVLAVVKEIFAQWWCESTLFCRKPDANL